MDTNMKSQRNYRDSGTTMRSPNIPAVTGTKSARNGVQSSSIIDPTLRGNGGNAASYRGLGKEVMLTPVEKSGLWAGLRQGVTHLAPETSKNKLTPGQDGSTWDTTPAGHRAAAGY
jgi:hypothetical protein